MFKIYFLFFAVFLCKIGLAQKEPLFNRQYHKFYDSCTKKARDLIQRETDYRFGMHPLEWAQEQIDSNLLKTDTLHSFNLNQITISYYNKKELLFLIVNSSSDSTNSFRRIKVFDESGNLVLNEGAGYRLRRGYNGFKTMFECYYFDTPIFRFNIFSRSEKIIKPTFQVCNCNF
ncbi:MAG: hypothetical protein V4685_11800 [Bacteroidota bacterium]